MFGLQGISVKLPLIYSPVDGPYELNKTLGAVVKQNFKNLLLTSPGERVMMPDFGVGLRRLLFEGFSPTLHQQVSTAISTQTSTYLPFINIEAIQFRTNEDNPDISLNEVEISVVYNLGSLDTRDTLTIT